jgi:hypothetical protein
VAKAMEGDLSRAGRRHGDRGGNVGGGLTVKERCAAGLEGRGAWEDPASRNGARFQLCGGTGRFGPPGARHQWFGSSR